MEGIAHYLYAQNTVTLRDVDAYGASIAGVNPVSIHIPVNTLFELHETYESQFVDLTGRDVSRDLSTYTAWLPSNRQVLVIAMTPTRYDLYSKLNQSMASAMKHRAIVNATLQQKGRDLGFDIPDFPTVLSAGMITLIDKNYQEYPSFLKLGMLW